MWVGGWVCNCGCGCRYQVVGVSGSGCVGDGCVR